MPNPTGPQTPLTGDHDTIVAQASAPGRGGVGVIRLSGPLALAIAEQTLGYRPRPRHAHYGAFLSTQGQALDQGIALYFPAPNSFTGEPVVELQAHGGPVIMDMLIEHCLHLGARLARPGEFSERAFLNGKLDLAQAEAVADLINAASRQAAQQAMLSLQGEFSKHINTLVEALIQLRVFIEAALDFPDEDLDFIAQGQVIEQIQQLLADVRQIQTRAQQGSLLREGLRVVLVGRPNAGKSSLLNALAGQERAIVTQIPGTTRDLVQESIQIDGLPVQIIDTAGLRHSTDPVEQEGIRRTWQAIETAHLVLLVFDASQTPENQLPKDLLANPNGSPATNPDNPLDALPRLWLRNKVDLTGESPGLSEIEGQRQISLSAHQQTGLESLRRVLKETVGYEDQQEGNFLARRRHLDALARTQQTLEDALAQFDQHQGAELLAEDLRSAQQSLGEITGTFSSDDLLGRIFSEFCIGK